MNYFREDIKNEQRRIQRLIDLAQPDQPLDDAQKEERAHAIKAKRSLLNANRRGNSTYYYEICTGNGQVPKKIYLGSAQSPRAQQLADERFRAETMRRLQRDAQLLEQMAQRYMDYDSDAVLDALPRTYREVVRAAGTAGLAGSAGVPSAGAAGAWGTAAGGATGLRGAPGASAGIGGVKGIPGATDLTGDGFRQRYAQLQAWAAEDYEKNTAPYPEAKIYAKDGTRMRSKGECIFYNIFDELRLPNRYDSVIEATDRDGRRKLLSPDFLVQCFDRRLIAIEHLGWYSGLKYGIDFGEKCWWYLQEGFILGQNFFVTSDDAKGGTDSRMILNVARQVERMVYGY